MIITIIGLGLIGGSIAIGLRESGFASRVIGVDNSPVHAEKAIALSLVDEVLQLAEAVRQSKVIILSLIHI